MAGAIPIEKSICAVMLLSEGAPHLPVNTMGYPQYYPAVLRRSRCEEIISPSNMISHGIVFNNPSGAASATPDGRWEISTDGEISFFFVQPVTITHVRVTSPRSGKISLYTTGWKSVYHQQVDSRYPEIEFHIPDIRNIVMKLPAGAVIEGIHFLYPTQ